MNSSKDIDTFGNEVTNLAMIGTILNEMRVKSGEKCISLPTIQTRERSFIEKIEDDNRKGSRLGMYNFKYHNIILFSDTYGIDLNENEKFFTLVHELVHAFGKNNGTLGGVLKNISTLVGAILNPGVKHRSGYSSVYISWYVLPKIEKKLHEFNESITDLIAREVIKEYNMRTKEKMKYLSVRIFDRDGMRKVNKLISLISNKSQSTREQIIQALIQGYFSGLGLIETLMNPEYGLGIRLDEMQSLFEEDLL